MAEKVGDTEVKVRLVDHDDAFYYAPVYEVCEDDDDIVISGVPPNIAKAFDLDE